MYDGMIGMDTKRKETENNADREARLIDETLRGASKQFGDNDAVLTFMHSVLTQAERRSIGRRLLIARLYLEGYRGAEIRELLRVSPNTLSTVRAWLGDVMKNYDTIYQKSREHTPLDTRPGGRTVPPPCSFARMRQQYPGHFLLFNLIAELRKKD